MAISVARHIDYTLDGIPIVQEMPSVLCTDSPSEQLMARHTDFTLGVYSVVHWATSCCDVVDDLPKVHEDCLPGGISQKLVLYAYDVENCYSARRLRTILTYSEEGPPWGGSSGEDCLDCEGRWYGTLPLAGGSLQIEGCCELVPGDLPGSPSVLTFTLKIGGCVLNGDRCLPPAQAQCIDPIVFNFGNVDLPSAMVEGLGHGGCCDCVNLVEQPTINLTLLGNCRRAVYGRHIDYDEANVPIVAIENCDPFAGGDPCESCVPRCDLHFSIEAVDEDCDCMITMDAPLPYASVSGGVANWINDGFQPCGGGVGSISFSCRAATQSEIDGLYDDGSGSSGDGSSGSSGEGSGECTGWLALSVVIVCGITGGGSKTIFVPAENLTTLDVVFEFTVAGTASPCTGNCNYTYIEMLPGWMLAGDTCTEDCDPCPENPTDSSPASDGATRSQACTGGLEAECCTGTIRVRVTA